MRRIHHVGITVADLERSLGFYRDLLGLRVLGLSAGEEVGPVVGVPGARARIADLDAGGGQILELLQYDTGTEAAPPRGPDAAGSCHVSLEVADLDVALGRLAGAGHRAMGEVAHLAAEGIWQDCTIAYLRDPDGVIVELLARGPRNGASAAEVAAGRGSGPVGDG